VHFSALEFIIEAFSPESILKGNEMKKVLTASVIAVALIAGSASAQAANAGKKHTVSAQGVKAKNSEKAAARKAARTEARAAAKAAGVTDKASIKAAAKSAGKVAAAAVKK